MFEPEDTNLLVLIPAYNEERAIAQVVSGAKQYFPVLVVDDGSRDDTARLAEEAGAMVIRQNPNQGKGAALRAGFRAAIQDGRQAVITLDADRQHDPAEIPAFLEVYQQTQADLIIGERDFTQMPASRRLANTLGRWSFSWAMGQPVRDNQSGYRLISRRLMEAVLQSQEHGFEFEVEMIVICLHKGYKLDWSSIRTIYAGEKSHIRPYQHVRNFLRVVIETRRQMKKGMGSREL